VRVRLPLHVSESLLSCTRCDARCTKDGVFYAVEESYVGEGRLLVPVHRPRLGVRAVSLLSP
jgi:hypothetical protein